MDQYTLNFLIQLTPRIRFTAGTTILNNNSIECLQFYGTKVNVAYGGGNAAQLYIGPSPGTADNGSLRFRLIGHNQLSTPQDGVLEPSTDGTRLLYTPASGERLDVLIVYRGSGSPEGVVTAPIGSIYINTLGGAGTTMYIKESGTGNTGWIAK